MSSLKRCVVPIVVLFLIIFSPVCVSEDDSEELDPFDMINFDHASMSMTNKVKVEQPKETNNANVKEKKKDNIVQKKITPHSPTESLNLYNVKNEQPKFDISNILGALVPYMFKVEPPKKRNSAHIKEKKKDNIVQEKITPPKIVVPTESLNSDNKVKNEQPKFDISKCPIRKSPASPLFRQLVKTYLYHMKGKVLGDNDEYDIRVVLSSEDIDTLQKYWDSETEVDLHSAHQILTKMIYSFQHVEHGKSGRYLWIEDKLGISIEKLFYVVALLLILLIISAVLVKLQFTLKQLILYIVIFLFIGSIMLNWYTLYKKEVSKQHAALNKDLPDHCKSRDNQDTGFMSVTFSWFTSSFTFQKDECQEYFEHLLIDPLVKVSPMDAFAVTTTRFFISPLRHIAEELNKSLRVFLKDLPVQLWPIAIGGLSLFSFLILFMGFGYRVALPFGMVAIEPGQRNNRQEIQAIEENHRQEIKETKNMILDQQKILQDLLTKHLEEGSKKAIGFNGSGDNFNSNNSQDVSKSSAKSHLPVKHRAITFADSDTPNKTCDIGDEGIDTSSDSNTPPKLDNKNKDKKAVHLQDNSAVTSPGINFKEIGALGLSPEEPNNSDYNRNSENNINGTETIAPVQCTDTTNNGIIEVCPAKPSSIPVRRNSTESPLKNNITNIGHSNK